MKRIVSTLMLLAMLLTLASCGKSGLDFGNSAEPDQSRAPTNSTAPSTAPGNSSDDLIYPDDGYAKGYIGDTLRTKFFDMRITDAYSCYEFDGVTAPEGWKLIVVDIYLYNYTSNTQPMNLTDFEIWWDAQPGEDEDDAWDFPLFEREELEDGTYEYYNVSDLQLPVEYQLNIRGTQTGILLYAVPEGSMTYSIAFLEYFANESTGDLFEVVFSAPER